MTVLPALGTVSRALGYTFCEHPVLHPIKEKVVGDPRDNFETLQDFESTVKRAINTMATSSQHAEILKEDFRLHMHGVKDELCKSNRCHTPLHPPIHPLTQPLPHTLSHTPSYTFSCNFPCTPSYTSPTHPLIYPFSPPHIPSFTLSTGRGTPPRPENASSESGLSAPLPRR